MEKVCKDAKTNPAATASLLSKVFFWWLNPLFTTGYKRRLEEDDMFEVLAEDRSDRLGHDLQRYWDREFQKATKEMRTPRLSKVIIQCYWKSYAVLGLFTLVEEIIKVVQPVLLGKMIEYFETYDPDNMTALYQTLGYGAGLSVCAIGLVLIHHLYFFHVQRAGMKIRVAMCHMIYKKALCLSSSAMGKTTTGQIVNLLSNDVNRFDDVTIFLHFLWVGPLQAAVVVGLLWLEIGPSCLAGMVVLMFLMPTQTMVGRLFSKFRSQTAVLTDSRIRTMNEVVSGIRIIKMYAWEKPFAALVSDIRRKEISKIMKSSYLRGLNMASFFCASKIIVFVTFTLYVLLGNKISASRVFVTVSLYTAVRLTVTLFFPNAIEKLFESRVSIRRIQEFLLLGEITKSSANLPKDEKKDAGVEVQDLTCYWDKSLDAPSLQNVSFSLKSNQLVAVIGPVGAGKSSLLSSILGELPAEKGVLKVKGQLTYAAQQPWVFPGSIRSNILFGKELNPQKYERTIRACALKRDLQLLPDGDQMLIGDRGATLSGGQKARVNLARAVYQDADIYLLDDPLSAVDAEVGRHLFEQCICGLLKNKPRILVTHQLQYLKAADQIVVLKEGHMVAKGTYTELQQSGVDFTSLLKKDEEDEQQQPAQDIPARSRTLSQNSVLSQTSSVQSVMDGDSLPAEPVQTLAEESRAQGTIGVRLYVKYLRAGASIVTLLAAIVLNLLAQGAYIMQDWWLAYWADEQEKLDALNTTITNAQNATQELDRDFYLGIYAGLTGATIIFGFMRNLVLFNVLVRCAQSLHNGMFNTILRTPVRFFDINPIGRILNRFSKDIGQLDSNMPWTFVDFIQVFLQILGVIAVAASVIPWILIPVVPLLIVFIFLRRYFLQTSRDIKRLESTTRSPVFSHLSSSLQGLWTIRAFGAEERFQNTFDAHQDLHSEAWFLFLTTSRWFAVRLDFICAVFVTITTFGCVLLRDQLDAGSVGLALSYAVTLTGMFQWGVRQSAEVENMVQLKSAVEEMPGKLETVLAESGSNFSVGQRQLVCLARAILRKNRILIIDEATANVDPRTDELIQKTIRDKFRECTVLTIAHRLNTIIDSDRILVLDAGEIHAYDEPYSLLQDPNGTFYKMVQQTGKQEAAALQSAAEQVYSNRSRANVPNGHAETADGNIVIFETAL
ncbi:multidrug resistance-associated protein 4 isoform X2 [Amphiprion ocellaris]|uniref:multidrug resistance-associated protein 4 isoform X2 n=1 Tax=Amphiprion ocellaris TaxID=80972 RepID=UPI002410E785|nr:multidrug resistance-associated protein 4 isoform X2 [Amphiprion ocellaris]